MKAVVFALVLMLFHSAYAQCRQEDKDSVAKLIERSNQAKYSDLQQAERLITRALQLSSYECMPLLRSAALREYSDIAQQTGDWKGAIETISRAIELARGLDTSKVEQLASLYLTLGNIYNSEAAYFERNKLFDNADTSVIQAQRNYQLALSYADSAHAFELKAKALLNLGTTAYKLFQDSAAYDYYNKALQMAKSADDAHIIALINQNLGILEDTQGNTDSARAYYLQAKEIYTNIGDIGNWININTNLANLNDPEDSQQTLKLLREADSLAQAAGFMSHRGLVQEYLYMVHKRLGNYEQALAHHELYRSIQDSLMSASFKDKELRVRYETTKKQEQLEREKAERYEKELALVKSNQRSEAYRLWTLIGSSLAVVLIGFFAWRSRTQSIIRQQEEEIHQQKLSVLEENKRIDNANALLKGQDNERVRIAEEIHDKLGGTLVAARMWIEIAINEEIPSKESITQTQKMLDMAIEDARSIAHNLIPGSLNKFGLKSAINELVENLNVPGGPLIESELDDLDPLSSQQDFHLYRIVQEILNNAIKHAKASQIKVQLKNTWETGLKIIITDDGRGFNASQNTSGIGLKTLRRRANVLNAKVQLQTSPGKGTQYLISLKTTNYENYQPGFS